MGIFTRVRDIISANINAMLDKAEDPEKLVKLMIREMEDTLIEVKANCAGSMATKKRIQREIEEMLEHAKTWDGKAALAVDKGREDLAREALQEKRRFVERAETLENELEQAKQLVTQYQSDIMQLEDKLGAAREKQRMLVQRHRHAVHKKTTEEQVRRFETAGALQRFDAFQERIDRMEAEADLVNYGRKQPGSLAEQFAALESDDEIEQELAALKARRSGSQETAHHG
ncbi:MAG: Phage shock protein [Candidatus Hydrogenedentota bacterium]|jgi:phage shock protein A